MHLLTDNTHSSTSGPGNGFESARRINVVGRPHQTQVSTREERESVDTSVFSWPHRE